MAEKKREKKNIRWSLQFTNDTNSKIYFHLCFTHVHTTTHGYTLHGWIAYRTIIRIIINNEGKRKREREKTWNKVSGIINWSLRYDSNSERKEKKNTAFTRIRAYPSFGWLADIEWKKREVKLTCCYCFFVRSFVNSCICCCFLLQSVSCVCMCVLSAAL